MILPGTKVKVFDHTLFKDDISTPLSFTMRDAIVLRRYGCISTFGGKYSDLVDVKFLHNNRESKGHFTDFIRRYNDINETVL